MKVWIRIIFTVACMIGGLTAISKVFADTHTLDGTVSKISDGDTIHFQQNNNLPGTRDLKIRLLGIDAPESHYQNADGVVVGQGKWGQEAGYYLNRLIPVGTPVTIKSPGLDKYHRVLATIYYKGHDVNLAMVAAGEAVPYVICEGQACDETFFVNQNVAAYLAACNKARSAGQGVFNPAHPLEEMPYEFRLREGNRTPEKFVGDFFTKQVYAPTEIRRVDVCKRIFFMNLEDAQRAGFRSAN